jgi:hypothetical protein
MPETAAGTGVEAVAVDDRQMVVHRAAAARRFLDDDAAIGPLQCDLLNQISVGQGRTRQTGARYAPDWHWAGPRFAPAKQITDARFQARHDGAADGRPGSDRWFVDELEQVGAVRNVRAEALDMVSEDRGTQHQDQVMAGEAGDYLRAVGGKKAGK